MVLGLLYDNADIVYKNKNPKLKHELEYLSRCLAQQTIASKAMVNLMYGKIHRGSKIYGDISEMTNIPLIEIGNPENTRKIKTSGSNVEKRILLLKAKQTKDFDGNIDNLI